MPGVSAEPEENGFAFRDRPLNQRELEQLRLALSSFRDGSGQNVLKSGESMPGFRDYERSLAAVVGGTTPENKGVFDVQVATESSPFGISCKMASFQPERNLSCFMELSNSAAKFRKHLLDNYINWATEPTLAGPAIIDLVTQWHHDVAGSIDVDRSKYAVLLHDPRWENFQLWSFPLDLKIANPKQMEWLKEGASLNGYYMDGDRRHRLWQCYMESGGQLKYYPLIQWADWNTQRFPLEKPPPVSPLEKPKLYFPDLWPQ